LRDLDALELASAEAAEAVILVSANNGFARTDGGLQWPSTVQVERSRGVRDGDFGMGENVRLMGLPELRSRGFDALVRELGIANALRYLHLHGMGSGDYTKDRERWLAGLTIEQVEEGIRRMKLQRDG